MRTFFKKPIHILFLCAPATLVVELLHGSPVWLFILSMLGIVPLASLLGEATEELAIHTGPKIGGLLNATLGNAAELIITLVALRAGLIQLVKASITGSIIGNLLLIMGAAIFFGGLRHGVQRFDRSHAGISSTQMALAIIALTIPTLFARAIEPNHAAMLELSLGVAAIMMGVYLLSLIFLLRGPDKQADKKQEESIGAVQAARWSPRFSIMMLLLCTVGIAWLSEVLVGVVEPAVEALGLSEFFVGIIIIPIVGNAAEHVVAISVARKNKMDLSMGISLGSSMQIALFVAPLLVFASVLLAPEPMDLVFHPFELAALGAATVIASLIARDGESNWMEGAQLLAVFLMIAVAFFFLPM